MTEWRYFPEGWREEWERLVGPPPEDFTEVYELLCEALYFGVRSRDPGERGGPRKGYAPGYWFGDASLLEVKTRADKFLSQSTKALRRRERQGEGGRKTRPHKARGVPVSGTGRSGHRP